MAKADGLKATPRGNAVQLSNVLFSPLDSITINSAKAQIEFRYFYLHSILALAEFKVIDPRGEQENLENCTAFPLGVAFRPSALAISLLRRGPNL